MSITDIDAGCARVLAEQEVCAYLVRTWEPSVEIIDLTKFGYNIQQVFQAFTNGAGDGLFPFGLVGQCHLLREMPIGSIEDLAKICETALCHAFSSSICDSDLRQLPCSQAMRIAKLAYRTAYFKLHFPLEYSHAFSADLHAVTNF